MEWKLMECLVVSCVRETLTTTENDVAQRPDNTEEILNKWRVGKFRLRWQKGKG